MEKNNSESSKKITVTLSDNLTPIPTYDLTLVLGNSDYMEVQLARKTETDSEITIHVESVFRITQNAIPQFARQFVKYLQETPEKQESQDQPNT